jgi:hypothetical protein
MRFYALKSSEPGSPEDKVAGTDALFEEGFNTGAAPRCPACGKYIDSLPWLPPYRIELETWGPKYGDIVFATGNELLVSSRFKQAYLNSDLLGLSGFEPVEVIKVKRHRKSAGDLPLYFKANVIHSQATIDIVASGYEWSEQPELCPVCRLDIKGVTFLRRAGTVIESDTWTGEDIFIPRASADFLATPRFKDFCEQNYIANANFVPAETFGVDFYPSEEKVMERVLRRWENRTLPRPDRQSDYRALSFWVRGDRDAAPKGDFDPDFEIDFEVIEQARQWIGERLRKDK